MSPNRDHRQLLQGGQQTKEGQTLTAYQFYLGKSYFIKCPFKKCPKPELTKFLCYFDHFLG